MKGISIMWDYIRQEQAVLSRLLENDRLPLTAAALPELDAVYIVAHGSSYNSAVVMSDFLSRHMKARVYSYTPANFIHSCHALECEDRKHCIVIAISQTGTSRGLLEAAGQAKNMGFVLLSITQAVDSPLHLLSDHCLFLECGQEDSNAKTKGYSSTLLLLMLFGIQYGVSHGRLEPRGYEAVLAELRQCVGELNDAMDKVVSWCKKNSIGWKLDPVYVLGSGMNLGTAMEGQLKLMETMCIPTMFNDIEEFSHGMHRSIGRHSCVLLLSTDSLYTELTEGTFSYLLGKTDRVLMIYAGKRHICHENVLKLNYYPLTQSVLLLTMAIQILSVFIPEECGYDPNRAANDDYTEFVHTRVS